MRVLLLVYLIYCIDGMDSWFFLLMLRRPPRSTRTDTLFHYTTLFRSPPEVSHVMAVLAFGQRVEADRPGLGKVLVHCHMGISRSTAAAAIDRKSTRLNSSH